MASEASEPLRSIGAKLADFASQNAHNSQLASTLQGLAADLTPHQPDLAIPLRDLVSRPLFLESIKQAQKGPRLIQRDALINDLSRIYSEHILDSITEILNGFFQIAESPKRNAGDENRDHNHQKEDWHIEEENDWQADDIASHTDADDSTKEESDYPNEPDANDLDDPIYFGYLDDIATVLGVPVGYVWAWCIDNKIRLSSIHQPLDYETAQYIHTNYKASRLLRLLQITLISTLAIAIIALITQALSQ